MPAMDARELVIQLLAHMQTAGLPAAGRVHRTMQGNVPNQMAESQHQACHF